MTADNIKLKAALITLGTAIIVAVFIILKGTEVPISLNSILPSSAVSKALVVAPSGAVLRSEPSTESDKAGSLPFLTYVEILDDNTSLRKIENHDDKWYRVKTSAGEGWVWSGLLALEGSPVYASNLVPNKSDLEIIKDLKLAYFADKVYLYDGLNSLAGVSGKSEWKVFKPSERVEGKKLMLVQGLASYEQKSFIKGTKQNSNVELLLAVDLENGQYEFIKANQDGKSLSKIEMMIMFGANNGIY